MPDGPESSDESDVDAAAAPVVGPAAVPAPAEYEQASAESAANAKAETSEAESDEPQYPDTSVALSYEQGSGVRVQTQSSQDVSRQVSQASLRSDSQRSTTKGIASNLLLRIR